MCTSAGGIEGGDYSWGFIIATIPFAHVCLTRLANIRSSWMMGWGRARLSWWHISLPIFSSGGNRKGEKPASAVHSKKASEHDNVGEGEKRGSGRQYCKSNRAATEEGVFVEGGRTGRRNRS